MRKYMPIKYPGVDILVYKPGIDALIQLAQGRAFTVVSQPFPDPPTFKADIINPDGSFWQQYSWPI